MQKLIVLLLCLGLCGCATVGKPMKDTQLTQLQDGVTTQKEVLEIMGEPSDKTIIDTGEEKWTYIYARSRPTWASFVPYVNLFESGAVTKGQKLEILFDEKKIVKKHAFSKPTTSIKSGILQ
jgi:outer membrane protein assembly factor BamE (lipoprotein component of BamABCDE complex)